jgi:hypothetical protein
MYVCIVCIYVYICIYIEVLNDTIHTLEQMCEQGIYICVCIVCIYVYVYIYTVLSQKTTKRLYLFFL